MSKIQTKCLTSRVGVWIRRLLPGLIISQSVIIASGQRYNAGDIVQDFTLSSRATGSPIRLSDFAGKIIFLEWFAWW